MMTTVSFTTDAARWRALCTRDPIANGHFVYSVKSTSIYCRPTCPARLARRANVGFYRKPAEAEAAGFRACKRCKPNEEITEDPQEKAVAKACTLIEEAVKQDDYKAPKLQDLAKSVGLTPRYFHKIFKDRTGLTPKEYAKAELEEKRMVGFTATPEELQISPEAFHNDSFNFNDLVDFDYGDMTLSMDGPDVLTQMPVPGLFRTQLDANIQVPAIAASTPDATDAGISVENDKFSGWVDATSISDAAMTVTTATFELDAALFLSSGNFMGFADKMSVNAYV